jgi:hypothetical protein
MKTILKIAWAGVPDEETRKWVEHAYVELARFRDDVAMPLDPIRAHAGVGDHDAVE